MTTILTSLLNYIFQNNSEDIPINVKNGTFIYENSTIEDLKLIQGFKFAIEAKSIIASPEIDFTGIVYDNESSIDLPAFLTANNRAIWGFQDFSPGEITSTSVTLTKNENGVSAPFSPSSVI